MRKIAPSSGNCNGGSRRIMSQRSSGFGKIAELGIIAGVVLLALLATIFILVRQAERKSNLVYQTDADILLAACRTLIHDREKYRQDDQSRIAARIHPAIVVHDPSLTPLETNVPSVIRGLNPKLIVIGSNKVTVCLWTLPKRYLFGFAEGADEYGSERITNGLWFWYGN